jgi:hypothetical protein
VAEELELVKAMPLGYQKYRNYRIEVQQDSEAASKPSKWDYIIKGAMACNNRATSLHTNCRFTNDWSSRCDKIILISMLFFLMIMTE